MPYCEKCEAERAEGMVYCPECGSHLAGAGQPEEETAEQGIKMGEAAGEAAAAPTVSAQPAPSPAERSPRAIWRAIGTAGKTVVSGSLLAIAGFFIPSTQILPPGLLVTRSLATIDGVFLLIPLLSIIALALVYLSVQERPLRNRLYIQATVVAIGAFVLPLGLFAWSGGLFGGLLVFLGSALVVGGGYGMISDSVKTQS